MAAFPSSYIPTTTASATRAADILTVPVSGIDYPLSLYAEFERAVDTGGFENIFFIQGATSENTATLYLSTSDLFTATCRSANVVQGTSPTATAPAVGSTYKSAGRFATDDMIGALGGGLGTKDASVTLPASAPATIAFGASVGGGSSSYGYLRRAAIYSRALTDAELQAVTT